MMNPYLNIPIILPGNEGDEPKKTTARVQPDQIQCYYAGYNFGSLIWMIGGVCMMTELKPEEIDYGIDQYWKQVAEKEKSLHIQLLQ